MWHQLSLAELRGWFLMTEFCQAYCALTLGCSRRFLKASLGTRAVMFLAQWVLGGRTKPPRTSVSKTGLVCRDPLPIAAIPCLFSI